MRAFGDDVDNSINGICSPKCRSRSADDLDAGDILEHEILNLPERSREKGRVNCAAVDQDQ